MVYNVIRIQDGEDAIEYLFAGSANDASSKHIRIAEQFFIQKQPRY